MEKNKMIAALKKAMAIVSEEKTRRSNDLLVKEKLETVVPILENGFIFDLLFHEHFEEDVQNYKSMLDIKTENAYMMALVFGDEKEGNHMTNAVGSSVRIQREYKDIREYLKLYFDAMVGSIMGNKIAVLVPFEDEEMTYAQREAVISKAREFIHKINQKTVFDTYSSDRKQKNYNR